MGSISMEDIAMLESRVAHVEHLFGNNPTEKEATKSLEEVNAKVDKMLGKHPKTHALLKRLGELGTYTDPSYIMRYDPSKFIQQEYVVGSTNRLQTAAVQAKKIEELKGVVSPGNLKNVAELEKRMGPLTLKCLQLHDNGEEVNKDINELVNRWNGILGTLSEQFVTWDNLLRNAEEALRDQD